MPCISVEFQPNVGPLINIIVAPANSMRLAAGARSVSANAPLIHACPLLVDTGADITCISPAIASHLKLNPTGKVPVSVPTGVGAANTYLVDIGLPFGDPTQGAATHVFENRLVMEYNGSHPAYQGLLGRDVICLGVFSMAGYDCRYTFCL